MNFQCPRFKLLNLWVLIRFLIKATQLHMYSPYVFQCSGSLQEKYGMNWLVMRWLEHIHTANQASKAAEIEKVSVAELAQVSYSSFGQKCNVAVEEGYQYTIGVCSSFCGLLLSYRHMYLSTGLRAGTYPEHWLLLSHSAFRQPWNTLQKETEASWRAWTGNNFLATINAT